MMSLLRDTQSLSRSWKWRELREEPGIFHIMGYAILRRTYLGWSLTVERCTRAHPSIQNCYKALILPTQNVLLRFRREPVALMADIRSMFQVRVSKSDIDFLRFIWWRDGDIEQDPIDHRMLVHLFRAVSSPSCASFALQRTAEDNQHARTQVTDTIMHNFYQRQNFKLSHTVVN